ncbi:UDP-2,3-diacylglucosamine hydrolase [Deltaproteobacteria bacterium]|nr:UDP-2,3-diacylglucosamine hydrolase [Deltaproteobacteria bacterium]
MATLIVSDVHCDGPDSLTQQAFLGLLSAVQTDTLVLAGDIFHAFWAPNGTPFPAYQPVIEALRGRKLVVLPGNHDWGLPAHLLQRGFDPSAIVVTAAPNPARVGVRVDVPIEGLRASFTHGDEVDESWTYRGFHAILRSSGFGRLLDALGPVGAWNLLHRLAGPLGAGAPNPALVAAQRELAERWIAGGAQLVVTGHTHAPCCEKIGGGTWLNPGDWITHRTYGFVEEGRVELRTFTPVRG